MGKGGGTDDRNDNDGNDDDGYDNDNKTKMTMINNDDDGRSDKGNDDGNGDSNSDDNIQKQRNNDGDDGYNCVLVKDKAAGLPPPLHDCCLLPLTTAAWWGQPHSTGWRQESAARHGGC